jgi:hypothetical protein
MRPSPIEGLVDELGYQGRGALMRYSATHQLVRIVLQSLVTGPDWINRMQSVASFERGWGVLYDLFEIM